MRLLQEGPIRGEKREKELLCLCRNMRRGVVVGGGVQLLMKESGHGKKEGK